MTRQHRIHPDDLARIVRATLSAGLEIDRVTIDTEGGVSVSFHPQNHNVEATRAEIRAELEGQAGMGSGRCRKNAARHHRPESHEQAADVGPAGE